MEKHTTTPDGRTEIERSIHALRNGMNSLVMNAAVLARRADDFPQPLQPFVAGIAQAGRTCSEELTRLFALIDAGKS